MTNIVGTNRESKCLYCNSPSYGRGCPYSPHKLHVHIDDPKRCIYCSSQSVGTGCPYNPFSKIHVRGVEFNTMLKENVYNTFTAGLFLTRLTQPINETEAYKLGLISEEGRVIRNPETDSEKSALTSLDKYILKIRRMIGENIIELFKSNVLLELMVEKNPSEFDSVKYQKEIKLQSKVDSLVNDIFDIYSESVHEGFSVNIIEKFILESILKKYDNPKD